MRDELILGFVLGSVTGFVFGYILSGIVLVTLYGLRRKGLQ